MPSLKRRSLGQIESPDEEDSHLCTGDHGIGTVIGAAAACGDAIVLERFDPILGKMAGGIVKGGCHVGRDKGGTMHGTLEEDGHLRACDTLVGTVVVVSAAAGDAIILQCLDPIFCEIAGCIIEGRNHIRRYERGAVHATFEEDCHLSTSNGVLWTVIHGSGGATTGDAGII